MGYNIDNYRTVRDRLETRRSRALSAAEERRLRLHERSPEIASIDRALSLTGMKLFRATMEGGEGLGERLNAIKQEHTGLLSARAELLEKLSLPADHTEPDFTCKRCRDTGFLDAVMCDCMRRELIREGVISSGLGTLLDHQTFENFSLDYYRSSPEDLARMQHALKTAKDYASSFGGKPRNLLLMGGTGLGKTHLSTAMAGVIIERGFDVLYESALNVVADFEYDRYKSGYGESVSRGEKYLHCELLILDDLGTEPLTQFVVSCLYNLINTRLNHGRPTIINTNLTDRELRERYQDRITSRLLGEYEILLFTGKDIRMQKL